MELAVLALPERKGGYSERMRRDGPTLQKNIPAIGQDIKCIKRSFLIGLKQPRLSNIISVAALIFRYEPSIFQ